MAGLVTKKAFAEALKELMEHKTLDHITVKDITDRCEMNRQTFYYHFHDIYDLLDWIYRERFAKLAAPSEPALEHWKEWYLDLLKFALQNRMLVTNTLNSLRSEILENQIYQESFHIVRRVIDEVAGKDRISEENRSFLAHFYQYALGGVFLSWVKNGMQERPEQILEQISMTMDGTVLTAMERMRESGPWSAPAQSRQDGNGCGS